MMSLKNSSWVWIWIVSLVMIFEVEIRSIGHEELVAGLGFLPGLWIQDIGLLIPILAVLQMGKIDLAIRNNNLLLFFILFYFYGIMIFFIRGNPFVMFGQDLRVMFSILTGLSLGLIVPNNPVRMAKSITSICALAVLFATITLIALPDAGAFIYGFMRTTTPGAFILLGPATVLFAPAIVISTLSGNSRAKLSSWLITGVLLCVSILIIQTRSSAIAVILGALIALMTTIILSSYTNKMALTEKENRGSLGTTIAVVLFVVIMMYWLRDNAEAFLFRMEGIFDFEKDVGIAPRLEEIPEVFGRMELMEHLIGMGLNPPSRLVDWVGVPYNTMHSGILNIWWRLGFPCLLMVVFLFIGLLVKWLRALRDLKSQSPRHRVTNQTFAIISFAPGVIILFALSCMSGGWSISTMIPLGILWGMYRVMSGGAAYENCARSAMIISTAAGNTRNFP